MELDPDIDIQTWNIIVNKIERNKYVIIYSNFIQYLQYRILD